MLGGVDEPRAGHAPEFFAWPPLTAVLLFTLNNFWLKSYSPGVLSGKLSDFAACFFLPLFVSALLARATSLRLAVRVAVGALFTALLFGAVKTNPAASSLLDASCAVFLRSPKNCVDPSDLIALPMVPLACLWARAVDRRMA